MKRGGREERGQMRSAQKESESTPKHTHGRLSCSAVRLNASTRKKNPPLLVSPQKQTRVCRSARSPMCPYRGVRACGTAAAHSVLFAERCSFLEKHSSRRECRASLRKKQENMPPVCSCLPTTVSLLLRKTSPSPWDRKISHRPEALLYLFCSHVLPKARSLEDSTLETTKTHNSNNNNKKLKKKRTRSHDVMT